MKCYLRKSRHGLESKSTQSSPMENTARVLFQCYRIGRRGSSYFFKRKRFKPIFKYSSIGGDSEGGEKSLNIAFYRDCITRKESSKQIFKISEFAHAFTAFFVCLKRLHFLCFRFHTLATKTALGRKIAALEL